jgi:hypothetical protein
MKLVKSLNETVSRAVSYELTRANEKFEKTNNSPHESYAVILEEYEEAAHEADKFKIQLDAYWKNVKNNAHTEQCERLLVMQEFAIKAAAEFIQVAAMCEKATCKPGASGALKLFNEA